jgi:hypothetical protein
MLTEKEVEQLEKEYAGVNTEEIESTTAPEGAPIEEVQAGMMEVAAAREAAAKEDADASEAPGPSTLGTTIQAAEQTKV